jgi:hypothetical protein
VVFSASASYLYMMLFGWFVGSMSLSNALCMWQREGCDAMDSHCHLGLAGMLIRLAQQAEVHVGIQDAGYLPFLQEEATEKDNRRRRSWVFAAPRALHWYYLLVLSPPIRLLVEDRGRLKCMENS